MDGSIIVFSLRKGMNNNEKSRFCQLFYGQDTVTWKGRYTYHRHGLLDEIPHRKLARGVLIIRSSDLDRIMDHLKGSVEEMHVRTVILLEDDIRAMEAGDHPGKAK